MLLLRASVTSRSVLRSEKSDIDSRSQFNWRLKRVFFQPEAHSGPFDQTHLWYALEAHPRSYTAARKEREREREKKRYNSINTRTIRPIWIYRKKHVSDTIVRYSRRTAHLPVALSNPYSGNSDREGGWWRRWCEMTRRVESREEEHRRLNAEMWWRFGGHIGAYI